jgi:hypothetical protein
MCSCYACRVPIRARTAVSVRITRRPLERAHRSHRCCDAMLATLVPQVDTRTSCDCDANMSSSNVTSAELRRVTNCRPAVLPFGAPVGNGRPAHICTGTASTVPHLHREWAHPTHICAGTGLHCATSAPGLGPPLPHLHRNWAFRAHICKGTGPAPAGQLCAGADGATRACGAGSRPARLVDTVFSFVPGRERGGHGCAVDRSRSARHALAPGGPRRPPNCREVFGSARCRHRAPVVSCLLCARLASLSMVGAVRAVVAIALHSRV